MSDHGPKKDALANDDHSHAGNDDHHGSHEKQPAVITFQYHDFVQFLVAIIGAFVMIMQVLGTPGVINVLDLVLSTLIVFLILGQFYEFKRGQGNWVEVIVTLMLSIATALWGMIPADVANVIIVLAFLAIATWNAIGEPKEQSHGHGDHHDGHH